MSPHYPNWLTDLTSLVTEPWVFFCLHGCLFATFPILYILFFEMKEGNKENVFDSIEFLQLSSSTFLGLLVLWFLVPFQDYVALLLLTQVVNNIHSKIPAAYTSHIPYTSSETQKRLKHVEFISDLPLPMVSWSWATHLHSLGLCDLLWEMGKLRKVIINKSSGCALQIQRFQAGRPQAPRGW